MLKLIKSLKPFTWAIVFIFVLLLGQAIADLSLPDLMSRIINIGIQQNGIENVAPEAIHSSEMSKILLFASSDEKSAIANDYLVLDKNSLSAADYNNYLKSYPDLANGPIYKLNTADSNEITKLIAIFAKPVLIVSYIESGAAASLLNQQFPAGVDPFTALAGLPPAQLEAIVQKVNTQITALPESVITQSDISYLAAQYKAIGMDLNQMQIGYMVRIGGFMLLLTLASIACSITVGFQAARVAAGFGRDVRRKIFTKVESYSNREFDKFSTASLITRSTNDIQQIQLVLVFMLRMVFYAPMLGIGGIIKALGQDASMSWIIAAAVMALLTMVGIVFVIAVPKFRVIQKFVDKLNLVTREMLTGLMVVRAFNAEKVEEAMKHLPKVPA